MAVNPGWFAWEDLERVLHAEPFDDGNPPRVRSIEPAPCRCGRLMRLLDADASEETKCPCGFVSDLCRCEPA